TRNDALLEIGNDDRYCEADRNQRQKYSDCGEKPQRLFRPVEFQDGAENSKAVAPGIELAERSFGAGIIGRLDLGDRQRQFKRVDAQLGFYLEAIRQHRKGLDEAAREYPIAGKNILEGLTEHRGEKAGQHPVAGAVAAPIGSLRLVAPKTHHHVETLR